MFSKFRGTYFRGLWPKSKKLIPQKFLPARMSALKVSYLQDFHKFEAFFLLRHYIYYETNFYRSFRSLFLFCYLLVFCMHITPFFII